MVGTLCVFDPVPRDTTPSDLEPLVDLAAMVDDIIAARIRATVDELTGLQNRQGFIRVAEPLFRLADRTIAAAGHLLGETFRSADVVARLGGDEFVVLFAVSDEAGAAVAGARFDAGLAELNRNESLPFTLSIAAGFTERAPGGPGLGELLADADAAMYGEKRGSRTG